MSSILLNWLNEEVRLSQHIISLDHSDDFQNGYLLGEILHKHNQQANFSEFSHDNSPKAKVSNFCKLMSSLRSIDVHFDAKTVEAVMKADSSTIKRLLYDIKTSLDRIKRSSQLSSTKTLSSSGKMHLVSVVPLRKPKFEKTIDHSFENSLRSMVENEKDVIMSKVTMRFDEKETKFLATVTNREHDDLVREHEERHNYSDQLRSRKRHEKIFNDAWDHMNKEQWKANQRIAHNRREHKQRVELQEELNRRTRKLNRLHSDRDEMEKSIDEFEKKLDNELFKNTMEDIDELSQAVIHSYHLTQDPQNPTSLNQTLSAGFVKAQTALKDHHKNVAVYRQARDRHRSKFLAEQESSFQRQIHHEGQVSIYSMLLSTSHAERQEQEERNRVLRYEEVIRSDCLIREESVQAMEEVIKKIDLENNAEAMRRELEWIVAERLASQHERMVVMSEAKEAAETSQAETIVASLVDRLVDVTAWIASYNVFGLYGSEGVKKDSQDESMPRLIWEDAMRLFQSDYEIPMPLPAPSAINLATALPNSLSAKPLCLNQDQYLQKSMATADVLVSSNLDEGGAVSIPRYLADCDMKSYLNDIRNFEWTVPEHVDVVMPSVKSSMTKPKADEGKKSKKESTPVIEIPTVEIISKPPQWIKNTSTDSLFGEVVLSIDVIADPIPAAVFKSKRLEDFPVRMALCGVSSLCRQRISLHLQHHLQGVKFLNIEALVQRSLTETGSEIAEALAASLACGNVIADDIYVKLLTTEIESIDASLHPNGFVIEDFPNTKSQALLLFEALSGINYDAHCPQAKDRVTAFTKSVHREEIYFDPTHCGLNRLFLIRDEEAIRDVATVIEERVSARVDLLDQSTYFLAEPLDDACVGKVISEEYNPAHPVHLSAMDAMRAQEELVELEGLLNHMQLVDLIPSAGHSSYEQVSNHVQAIIQSYMPISDEMLAEGVIPMAEDLNNIPDLHENNSSFAEDSTSQVDECSVDQTSQADLQAPSISSVEERALKDISADLETTLPTRLATALNQVWKKIEADSLIAGIDFFDAMRDIRHQSSQRRRAIFDLISHHLISEDHRQELFDAFCQRFNQEIEEDFRHDLDCKAELLLRAHELKDQIYQLNEERKASADSLLHKLSSDGKLQLLFHRCQHEGAVFIQSELNRFYAEINILLDYSKAMMSFDAHSKVANALDEVSTEAMFSPISSPKNKRASNAGKDPKLHAAGKKKNGDRDASALRKLTAPILVDVEPPPAVHKPQPIDAKSPKGAKVRTIIFSLVMGHSHQSITWCSRNLRSSQNRRK
jgi:hypothetical protein